SLGEIGKPVEKIADEVCNNFVNFHESLAPLETHLADQLLIYLALADGSSSFRTSKISNHLITNAWLIKQFLPDLNIKIEGEIGEKGKISIEGLGFENENIDDTRLM
ncbi:MAG: RNA 3'-terminal phosphate cyclase, partial [Candidatus Bathyarchaeia archaeon]